MSRPGARPTLNTPKKDKRKQNKQNKTKRRKKFRSFSSSLAVTHNSLCVTEVTVGRSQGPEGQPASSLQMAPALLLCVSSAGRDCCPSLPPQPSAQGCSFTRRWAEGRVGEKLGQEKTAQLWRWSPPIPIVTAAGQPAEEAALVPDLPGG